MARRWLWQACLIVSLVAVSTAPAGKPSATPREAPSQGRLFVLSIGINTYPGDEKLECAVKDARDVAQVFEKKGAKVYSRVETKLLTNQHANRQGILEGLEWLQRE